MHGNGLGGGDARGRGDPPEDGPPLVWVDDDRPLREGQRTMREQRPQDWANFVRYCNAAQIDVPGPDWERGAVS